MSRAHVTGTFRFFEICHGHSQNVTGTFCFFFHHIGKFHLKEYLLFRTSYPRESSFAAKKILKMYQQCVSGQDRIWQMTNCEVFIEKNQRDFKSILKSFNKIQMKRGRWEDWKEKPKYENMGQKKLDKRSIFIRHQTKPEQLLSTLFVKFPSPSFQKTLIKFTNSGIRTRVKYFYGMDPSHYTYTSVRKTITKGQFQSFAPPPPLYRGVFLPFFNDRRTV